MPVDASIALGVKPMPIESPINQMAKMYEMQNAVQSNQLNQMKMDEYKRGLTEDEAVKNYFANTKRDDPNFAQGLYGISPKTGQAFEKFQAEANKEKALTEKAQLEGRVAKQGFNDQALRNLAFNTSNENIIAWGQDGVLKGHYTPQEASQITTQLLSIPENQRKAFLSSQGAKPSDLMTKPSNLAILQNELAALSPNDPNRAAYEAAIRKETLSADMQAYEAAKLQGYKGSIFDYKRDIAKAGSSTSTVVMPPQEKEFEKQVGKDQAEILKTSKASAEDAAQILATNMVGKNLLDKGMLTGVGAQFFTTLNQGLSQAGIDFGFADAAQNSQAYGALMATNTAKIIKQFGAGTGLSDADREYALKAAAGDIKMDEKAIRKILTINNTASQNAINKHNKMVKTVEAKTNTILPYAVEVTDYTAGIPSATDTTAKKGTKTLNKIFGF
jgi:hypothetical protein